MSMMFRNILARLADTSNTANGGALVGIKQAFSGAIARTVADKNGDEITAKDFGFKVSNTAAQNLAALKLAIAAVPAGGKLIIPADPSGGTFLLDATGGINNAATISANGVTIQLDGIVQSVGHAQQAGNPQYPIKVTGKNVYVTGCGTIQGDGTFDTANTGDETTFPGLLYVTGDNFTCFGPTIAANPKVGILLSNCKKAVIGGCTFTGGPNTYVAGNTAYFGVRTNSGSGHSISGNRVGPDAGGGVPIDLVFGLNTTNMLITGNICDSLWEKLAYLYCSNCTVSNNQVNYPNGNQTDAIRITGSNNIVSGNWTINANGGCTVYDGYGNQVIENQFLGCKQVGIYVTRLSGTYTGGFNDTVIMGNMCSAGSGGTLADGISVIGVGGDSARVRIQGNTVLGFAPNAGQAQIRLAATSPNAIYDSIISGNTVNGNATGTNLILVSRGVRCKVNDNQGASALSTGTGIGLDGCDRTDVAGNFLYNPGAWAIDLKANGNQSTDTRVLNTQSRGATNIGINNMGVAANNNYGRGNQYTDQPLIGTATLSAAVSTTVTHGGVAANAAIFLQEANASAGSMSAVKGRCYTALNGANFTIAVANGTAAAGTEQFAYEVVQ